MFTNRVQAGRRLAERLAFLRDQPVVVLALPRGGVPVAREVADALDAPLDVIVVRKLGVPADPELGMGAIGEDGARIINHEIVRLTRVTDAQIALVEERERKELVRRVSLYRGNRPRVPLTGRVALVVDDGIATGSTARAACLVARELGAARVVLAVPVAPDDWTTRMAGSADDYVCLESLGTFHSIGQCYRDFSATTDAEVVACLERTTRDVPGRVVDEYVTVDAGTVGLEGRLTLPAHPAGVVVFAHGSGSSRHSSRNRYVASVLEQAGLGTLLFDLLTQDEALDRSKVFAIEPLADRLRGVTNWLRSRPDAVGLPIGYFGASTGAAAALWAAADPTNDVAAVVSRGGRPDLAAPRLGAVRAPTLLIVGGNDRVVADLNRDAQTHLHCVNRLVVVPGAGHLFEEAGTLAATAEAARDWFATYLTPEPTG
ncbi:MAG: phosphoribosyltransferase family protein [Acidimicrobiia bacterium]